MCNNLLSNPFNKILLSFITFFLEKYETLIIGYLRHQIQDDYNFAVSFSSTYIKNHCIFKSIQIKIFLNV